MALTLTLLQLREEVGLCLDVPTGDAYLPSATLDRWINMAVQEYGALRAQYGLLAEQRATLTGTASTTPGADGFPANEILTLPSLFASLVALNYIDGTTQRPLTAMAESDRQRLWGTTFYGPPECYALIDATPSLSARVRVWPPMNSAYTFELIYRPAPAVMVLTSDQWEYLPGTEDYVICSVALKEATREGIQEPQQFQALQMRKQTAADALMRMAHRGAGVATMRDTRTQKALNRYPFPR